MGKNMLVNIHVVGFNTFYPCNMAVVCHINKTIN